MQDELISVGMSSPLIQEIVKEAEVPKEVTDLDQSKTEVSKETAPVSKTKPVDSQQDKSQPKESSSEDYSDYSGAALLALQFQKEGALPKDVQIDKNLTGQDLKKLYQESLKKDVSAIEEDLRNQVLSKGYDEEDLKYAKLLRQGTPQEDLSTVSIYRQMASIDTSDMDAISGITPDYLTQYFKDSGVKDPKDIKKLVDSELDEDGGESKMNEAKTFYADLATKELGKLEKEALEREKLDKEQAEKQTGDIKATIAKGKIGPYELTDADKQDFEKYLFEATEEMVGTDGKKHRVPAYYKDLAEYNNNSEQQLLMALMLKRKFSFEDIMEKGKEEDTKDMLDYLNKDTAKTVKESQKTNYDFLLQM